MHADVPRDPNTMNEEVPDVPQHPELVTLPLDVIINELAPFLGLKELYNVTQVNSNLKHAVTMDMAVKAVLLHSRYSLQSMIVMKDLVDHRSIYPASVDRIMRIGLGRRCEICLERKVHHLRTGHGVFVCWPCIKSKSKRFYKGAGSFFNLHPKICTAVLYMLPVFPLCYGFRDLDLDDDSQSPRGQVLLANAHGIRVRVLPNNNGRRRCSVGDYITYMLKKGLTDTTGTRVGPIVTFDLAVNQGMKYIVEMNLEGRDAINAHLQDLLQEAPAPSKNNFLYLQFLKAFDDNIELAKQEWYIRKSRREMKEEIYTNKRIIVAEKMIRRLRSVLNEPGMNDVLDFHVNENFRDKVHRRRMKDAPLLMNVWWVEKLLYRPLKCPSKVKGRVLKELAYDLKKNQWSICRRKIKSV